LYELYDPTLDSGPEAVDPEADETASASFALETREPEATDADIGRFRSEGADPTPDGGLADMGRAGRDAPSLRGPSTLRSSVALSLGSSQSGR
jgi:hypothetical protein